MLWGKKESVNRLPDLPPMKGPMPVSSSRVSFPAPSPVGEDEGHHALPSFPNSPVHNSFSQAAIKDAVSANSDGQEGDEFPDVPENKKFKIVEMDKGIGEDGWESNPMDESFPVPKPMSIPRPVSIPKPSNAGISMRNIVPEPPMEIPQIKRPSTPVSKASEIFVRMDKFHSARRALDDIKGKISEIDGLLAKIRETKLREEQELAGWEKDMLHVKTRLKDLNENIFEKGD